MNPLPSGWETVALSDVTRPRKGRLTPSPDDQQAYLSLEDVTPESTRILGWRRAGDYRSASVQISPGDVLYGRLRPYLNKVTVADRAGLASSEFIVLPGSPAVSGKWLMFRLNSSEFVSFSDLISDGDRPRIKWAQMSKFEFGLPPFKEQERMVSAIEEHLSRLDAAEAGIESARRRLVALKELTMTTSFALDAPLVAIGEIAAVGSGATPKRTNSRYWEGGDVPWVTSGALNSDIVTRPSGHITQAALRETSVRLWPAGTVLVAMYGEGKTRGRAAELAIESTCNQACAAIQPDPTVLRAPFLRWFINSRYNQTRRLASGGVQPNLSLGLVKAMRLPLPCLDEQDAIVERLERSREALDRLSREMVDSLARGRTARRSILAAAFSGRLVPQDPNDEPASALLDRIRAERAEAEPTRGNRRVKTS